MTAPKKGDKGPVIPKRDKVDEAISRLPKAEGYNIRVEGGLSLGDHIEIPVDKHGIPLTEYLKADLNSTPKKKDTRNAKK
jgi:hypothetical protein